MLTLRKRIFIIIGLISGLIIAFLLVYYLSKNEEINPTNIFNNNPDIITENNNPTGGATNLNQPVVEEKPVDMSVYAKQIAKIFVERFATYSNQNSNQNIDDVLPLSTSVMTKWLETQRKDYSTEYNGVNTSVIASRILNIDEDSATIELDVQQQTTNSSGVELKQRTGKVELVKDGSDWKVDGFYWNK